MVSSFFIQLYCEVRAKREGSSWRQNQVGENSLTIGSTSTGSSSLTDNSRSEPSSSSSSRSGTARITSLPGFAHSGEVGGVDARGHRHLTCFQEDPIIKAGGQKDQSQHELIELSSRDTWEHLSVSKTTDPQDISPGTPGYGVDLTPGSSTSGGNDTDGLRQSSPWSEASCGSEKKRNTTALNAVSIKCTINYTHQTSFCAIFIPPETAVWLLCAWLVWDLAYVTILSFCLCVSGSEGDRSCKQGALQLPG